MMSTFVHTVKKSLLVMVFLFLFIALSTFCGIVFLAIFQWFMHTEFYINMMSTVEFWLWVLGIPFILIFFGLCARL
ncbi:hypothetical protein CFK37_03935 [Virgibacillus phasianinus]|uniref:Uncharacterized protein n=1 Tax=Virgibacillus phasianinus TaxID=2017483 RepID=A0A220U013_9BACI|nr:hypothetical protein [Virgibacillus phasianinus]ASK61382.1 hypothetical protein CFK37_03935 [Virgibacillus phasianinus]